MALTPPPRTLYNRALGCPPPLFTRRCTIPINYRIDHPQRLVLAQGRGVLTHEDVRGYQREVWSRTDVAGYHELIDMSAVAEIKLASMDRVMELAHVAAEMDPTSPPSKLAVVAPGDLAYGLGRVFQVYRGMEPQSTKQVGVFRTLGEALAFLGLEEEPGER